eukprot:365535-Chlamydomonas_euryale.AAC.45
MLKILKVLHCWLFGSVSCNVEPHVCMCVSCLQLNLISAPLSTSNGVSLLIPHRVRKAKPERKSLGVTGRGKSKKNLGMEEGARAGMLTCMPSTKAAYTLSCRPL